MLSRHALVFVAVVAVCVSGCSAKNDKMAQAIQEALVAQQKDVADQCELAGWIAQRFNGASEPNSRWEVKTSDPQRQIWTIECVVNSVEITPTGKKNKTEVVYQVLFDSTTGSLRFDQPLMQALLSWGATDFNNRSIRLTTR